MWIGSEIKERFGFHKDAQGLGLGILFVPREVLDLFFFEWGRLISRTFVLVFICKHCFKLQNFEILFLPRGFFDLMFGFWVVWVILGTFILGGSSTSPLFKLQDLRILFLLIRCCCFWVGMNDFGSISFWVSFASPLFRTSKFLDSIFAKRSFWFVVWKILIVMYGFGSICF